ncbi:hypothetical protein J3R30DRAFT_3506664 [Lentinula aciculospora]|uniref:Uncharacterized protein n=1 Tax=Lentinula aciculospora TaxID=153920 RepID=A0A9W9A5U7_9AGAR|nr:hypothetical protein J3R30DRAFT_3506664 [Lentinula aciculospora]
MRFFIFTTRPPMNMTNYGIAPDTDQSTLNKMEKKIMEEGKAEDSHVSHTLKDLSKVEKASGKADKTSDKAEHALEKTHHKELKASKSLNKATHKHDLAVAAVGNAEKDAAVKKQESARLQAEVDQRKASVDGMLQAQRNHNSIRESKLAEINNVRAGTGDDAADSASA